MSQIRPFEVTHRGVLAIALPMTLAYLSTPLLGIVDTAVIGQLGQAHLLGGIAVGAIIFDVLSTTFNFLRSGTTGLTAQAMGADDRQAQIIMLLSLAIYAVLWLTLTPLLGNHGLWLALGSFLVVRGISLAARYLVRLARSFRDL